MISRMLSAVLARAFILLLLGGVAVSAGIASVVCRKRRNTQGESPQSLRRILVTGTFYSDGWIRSHLRPQAMCDGGTEIIVVCDAPLLSLENVRYICPSERSRRLLGRTVSRALLLLTTARRQRPSVVIGYHVMPNALLALVAARLSGADAVYQCCGGPSEVLGGGAATENRLLRRLGWPSAAVERALVALTRKFDAIVTRGSAAAEFFRRRGARGLLPIIPGSVDPERFAPASNAVQEFDMITVGRLVEVKRLDRFVDVVDKLRSRRGSCRAVIVGSGPLEPALKSLLERRDLTNDVVIVGHSDDVASWLKRAKVFVLTSASEGLAIALAESMMCGLPAVVTNVGDLSELVDDGRNGFLIEAGDSERFAVRAAELLGNDNLRREYGLRARRCAMDICSVAAVASRWHTLFSQLESGVLNTDGETGDSIRDVADRPDVPYSLPWLGKGRYD